MLDQPVKFYPLPAGVPRLREMTIYGRLSSEAQLLGTGKARQANKLEDYGAQNDMVITERLNDDGVSGYDGANLTWGDLGDFLKRVAAGFYPRGHNLAVENVDRITRQGTTIAQHVLYLLTTADITLHVIDKDMVVTRANRDNPENWMMLGLEAARGHSESSTKQNRILKSREMERAAIRENIGDKAAYRLRIPKWFTPVYAVTRRVSWTRNERVIAIVNRIFEMADQGMGISLIAATLNDEYLAGDESLAPFGAEHKRVKFVGKSIWAAGSILVLLRNRQVIGEYQPHRVVEQSGRKSKVRVPDGPPIKGHYEAIIPVALFNRVQQGLESRHRGQTPNFGKNNHNSTAKDHRNILSGLTRCALCGGRMGYRSYRGNEPTLRSTKIAYLVCNGATAHACEHVYVRPGKRQPLGSAYRYHDTPLVERLLEWIDEVNLAPPIATGEIAKLQTQLGAIQEKLADVNYNRTTLRALPRLTPEMWADVARYDDSYALLEKEAEKVQSFIDGLRAAPTMKERHAEFSSLRQQIAFDDLDARGAPVVARAKVNALLKQFVERIDFKNGEITLMLKGDARSYVFDAQGNYLGKTAGK